MNFSSRFDTPRFKVRIAVTISKNSQDISVQLPIGSEARFVLVDPATGIPLDLEGVVRRRTHTPKPLLAFDFLRVQETQRGALERLLNQPPLDLSFVNDGDPGLA
jgi:hypothetical protein